MVAAPLAPLLIQRLPATQASGASPGLGQGQAERNDRCWLGTAKTHLGNALEALGVANRTRAALAAHRFLVASS